MPDAELLEWWQASFIMGYANRGDSSHHVK